MTRKVGFFQNGTPFFASGEVELDGIDAWHEVPADFDEITQFLFVDENGELDSDHKVLEGEQIINQTTTLGGWQTIKRINLPAGSINDFSIKTDAISSKGAREIKATSKYFICATRYGDSSPTLDGMRWAENSWGKPRNSEGLRASHYARCIIKDDQVCLQVNGRTGYTIDWCIKYTINTRK